MATTAKESPEPQGSPREQANRLVVLIIEGRQLYRECLAYSFSQLAGVETIALGSADEFVGAPIGPAIPDVILLCVTDGEPLPGDLPEALARISHQGGGMGEGWVR
jgi:hypothetical protein